MSQYTTGVASVTNGSNVVTFTSGSDGVAPALLSNASIGDWFRIDGLSFHHVIASVDDDDQITLNSNWLGSTLTDEDYTITRYFTPNLSAPEVGPGDKEFYYNITKAFRIFDAGIGDGQFSVVDNGTDTAVTLDSDAFGTIQLFQNTSPCTVYLPAVSSDDIGKWIEIRKKGSGNLTILGSGDSIIETSTTIIYSTNSTPTFDSLLLFVESANHWSIRPGGMFGPWTTSSSSSSSSSRSSSSSSSSSSSRSSSSSSSSSSLSSSSRSSSSLSSSSKSSSSSRSSSSRSSSSSSSSSSSFSTGGE